MIIVVDMKADRTSEASIKIKYSTELIGKKFLFSSVAFSVHFFYVKETLGFTVVFSVWSGRDDT